MYLLSCKSEALKAYIEYEAWLYMQDNVKIKCLHSDRGGEYLSKEFSNHLATRLVMVLSIDSLCTIPHEKTGVPKDSIKPLSKGSEPCFMLLNSQKVCGERH